MFLHVPGPPFPTWFRSAQGRAEMEIRVLFFELLKFVTVHQTLLVAHSKNERQLPCVALTQVCPEHRPKWSNAGAGSHEDRVPAGISQHEVPQRRAHFHRSARLHRKQMRREETVLDQIQAKLKTIAVRSGGDRIRTRDLLIAQPFRERDELARNEIELVHLRRFEHEMPD